MPWDVYLLTEACSTAMIKDEVAKIDKMVKEQKAKGYKPTLPVALDVEEVSCLTNGGGWTQSNIANITAVFVEEIRSLGYYPMIYSGYWEFKDWITQDTLNKCDVWLAEWSRYPDYTKSNLGIWQYSDGATDLVEFHPLIDGFTTPIDKDIAYKDYPTIIKNGGHNGWGKNSDATPSEDNTTPSPTPSKVTVPDVVYKVRTGGTWLPEVKNMEDYAGLKGKAITDVAIKVSKGSIKYRVHVKGGSWLNWITKYDTSDVMGYAGNGKAIDAIQIYYYTPSDVVKSAGYYRAQYRVSPLNQTYYSYQYDTETTGDQDGYAGNYGTTLDELQIALTK